MELIRAVMHRVLQTLSKNISIYIFLRQHPAHQFDFLKLINKASRPNTHSELPRSGNKKIYLIFIWIFFIFSSKDMLFVVHTTSVKGATYTPPTPSRPMRSGGRILILVRQPDPRFTPRVWLVPIVHCQGLLMERQQWILSPHKWLSDRAPSSITIVIM